MAGPSRFPWRLALVVVVAILVTIGVRWPLSWATHWLPAGVQCDAPAGTVWHGRCGSLTADGLQLGDTSWQFHPLPLLRGTFAATVQSRQGADHFKGDLELRAGGRRIARHVEADLTLGEGLLRQGAMGLTGRVHAGLERAELHERTVRELVGTLTVQGLTQGSTPLGNYEISFPDASAAADDASRVTGALRDLGGPLGISGTLALTDEPGYVIDGFVTLRADTPPALARQIAILGTPDAAGRRPFSIAGTY